jgi:CubicO group peptidase (beta-lactamase class C family)
MTCQGFPRIAPDAKRVRSALWRAMLALLAFCPIGVPVSAAAQADDLQQIVDNFAGSAVSDGTVIGAEIAVLLPGQEPRFFAYGLADVAAAAPPSAKTIFQIGSVTKVFTTNLLGQAVAANPSLLNASLGEYHAQLGALPGAGPQVTLQQLGSFTAGYPTYSPICKGSETPQQTGCRPSARPTIDQYDASDFAAFFRNDAPQDQLTPPAITEPPFPYFYSDYSTGLIGLLLGSTPNAPLENSALTGWETLLRQELLQPLSMRESSLEPPSSQAPLLARGYQQALATAVVGDGGSITGFKLVSNGAEYEAAPVVQIVGGGGQGATALATVSNGTVSAICPANPAATACATSSGQGYLPPPQVEFAGGNPTTPAHAVAVIQGGSVVAIRLDSSGVKYQTAPTITISGGQLSGGEPAQATAHLVHGQVVTVDVTNGGTQYVDPLTVLVDPGAASSNPVPIWAPAGALKSSARDMASFAAAALLRSRVAGHSIPQAIHDGFAIAETPYACRGTDPGLTGCTEAESALAWDLLPSNQHGPLYVTKDGGLPGFSSYIGLLPDQDLAVVVLVNSRQDDPTTTRPAVAIGLDILWASFVTLSQ